MTDDTRGAGIELADTPEVKEASALALEAISEHYESNGHEIGADVDAAHIIALAIAAGQFKANQRAEKAERALTEANLKLIMLTLASDCSIESVRDLRDGEES